MVLDKTVDNLLRRLVPTDRSSVTPDSPSDETLPLLTPIASPKRSITAMVALLPLEMLLPSDHDDEDEVVELSPIVIASSSTPTRTGGATERGSAAAPLYRSPSTVRYPSLLGPVLGSSGKEAKWDC